MRDGSLQTRKHFAVISPVRTSDFLESHQCVL